MANAFPGTGLKVIAERIATLRVRGVGTSKKASSQSFATRIEKFHVSGAPVSLPPELSGALVHRPVERMAIDGCRGSVQPYPRRIGEPRDDVAKQARGLNAGVVDCFAVLRGVPAVDASAGQVDADVSAFQILRPEARISAVPMDSLPLARRLVRV